MAAQEAAADAVADAVGDRNMANIEAQRAIATAREEMAEMEREIEQLQEECKVGRA